MREKINSNPVIQVVVLGFLGIVVAFLFMTRVMGGSESSEPAPATTTPAPGVDVAAAESAAAGTAPAATAPADPSAVTPVEPAPTAAAPMTGETGFVAGPGLPKPVVQAHESGDVVVLLISKRGGIEDKQVRAGVASLRGRSDTTVFETDSRNVARYSRIAQGVDLDRAPALVVIKPRSVSGPGLPEASVAYGFRGPDGIEQAVRDALYKGKQLPYHPG